MTTQVSFEEAKRLSDKLNIDTNVVPVETFRHEIQTELNEHSDVIGNSPEKAARIALAHLREDPLYPEHMREMDAKARAHWDTHPKPSVLRREGGATLDTLSVCVMAMAVVLVVILIGYCVYRLVRDGIKEGLDFGPRNIMRRSRAPWMDARGYPRGGLSDFYFSVDNSMLGDSFDNCFNNPGCLKAGVGKL